MAVGRKTVAPHQTIASQWGNWAWDQTVQCFATTADRTSQFPNPPIGACCTVENIPGVLMQWNGTAWYGWQVGSGGYTANGSGGFSIPFPTPFAVTPLVNFMTGTGDASTASFLAVVVANMSATQLNGVASNRTGGLWSNAVISVNWMSYGRF